MEKQDRKTARRQMADNFIKAITEKPLKWREGFVSVAPKNGISGRKYTGLNHLILNFAMSENGWNDPRFYTGSYIFGSDENRKKDKDDPTKICVRKGEKAIAVEAHIYIPKDRGSVLPVIGPLEYWRLTAEEQSQYIPRVRDIPVFNAEQCTGVPQLKSQDLMISDERTKGYIDTAIENMGVAVDEQDYHMIPCYVPRTDEIRLPSARLFKSEHEYFTTKLHETCHATGHHSRLDRDLLSAGDEDYAKEELRAEIATCFIASDLELDMSNPSYAENHTAYIQSWAKAIKNDLGVLTSAIYDAEGIAAYVLDKAGFDKEQTENKQSEETMKFDKQETVKTEAPQKEAVKEKEAKAL